MHTTSVLIGLGLAILAVSLAAVVLGWITTIQAYGLIAVSQTVTCAAGFLLGHVGIAAAAGGVAAWNAWKWWNGGGGDGTRKRLRRWARRFHGVRRSAPAGA